ncbi:MAG: metal-dependent hydrolase [Polyangiaceae bacterium]
MAMAAMTGETGKRRTGRVPVVRKMGFDFTGLPRRWFGGRAIPTHVVNGLHLLFPAGERFFIRSVMHYMDRIADDPALVQRVRAFAAQEGRHGTEHEASFETMEAQGLEIRKFLAWYDELAWQKLEPLFPPSFHLAVTVALEHFTASLAEVALNPGLLDAAHPIMRDLLQWHAAEEIEHKSVAFDVFEKVDGRYSVRIAGLLIATAALLGFWTVGTRALLKQERMTRAEVKAEREAGKHLGSHWSIIRRAFVEYLRPGFHPDDVPNDQLAVDYFVAIGRAPG